MKFLFQDDGFSAETLRAATLSIEGGVDLGEIISTARRIAEDQGDAWRREWLATADLSAETGVRSLSRGHRISAREAFLRAYNYYRLAHTFSESDATQPSLGERASEVFARGAALFETPVEPLTIPFEGTVLHGYLFRASATGPARPTIIYSGDLPASREDAYFGVGAAGLRRGYNIVTLDGPGRGAALRAGLTARPDWEKVLAPLIDLLSARQDVDAERIILTGCRFGALQAGRVAALDPRPCALVAIDPIYDFYDANTAIMPPYFADLFKDGRDDVFLPVLQLAMQNDRVLQATLLRGTRAFGSSNVAEYLRQAATYTLEGVARDITCPTLVIENRAGAALRGHASRLLAELTYPREMFTVPGSDLAGERTFAGAQSRVQQAMFDWLDERL